MILALLLVFPFAILNHLLTNITLRKYYSLVVGLSIQYFMYGNEIVHTVLPAIFTYLFTKYLARRISPFWLTTALIAHLLYLHIDNFIYRYGSWEADVTTMVMLNVARFSSIAFSYSDGAIELDKIPNNHWRTQSLFKKCN